jgi:hypothetical protein
LLPKHSHQVLLLNKINKLHNQTLEWTRSNSAALRAS